jgi:AGZA family xanthine/uracil permease-like MFS transporter
MARSSPAYDWFSLGDLNGFFGLMFDNLTVLSFLAGTLVIIFKFPADIVYTRMFPGTAFGVLVGDLVYTWMAFGLAKRTGKRDVTAMPLGLDTPSTIGMALVVLGPAFLSLKAEGFAERDAAMMTWYIGMATMVMIGLFKVAFSFIGQWVQRAVPMAGLLGSLAGIGLALIGLAPLVDVFGMPVIGLLSLGLILYSLVARIRLPGNFPSVLAAIILGTVVYYVFAPTGWMGGTYAGAPSLDLHFGLPTPTLGFMNGIGRAIKYLPISIPFGLLTVVGGINVTESARVAGDDYNTRQILLTEAFATLIAGLCGGVAQSTPYIGQPAYKRMGARAGYTLLTGVFIGLGGMLGFVSFFVELIPRAVLAPILIFVALDIVGESFLASPARHAPAVAFSYFPTLARLLSIRLGNPDIVAPENLQRLITQPGKPLSETLVTIALGSGFILTAMLWGGFLAELIDRRLRVAAGYLVVMAAMTFFGVIHSASIDGVMYLPWTLAPALRRIPYQFALGYVVLAAGLLLLGMTKEAHEPLAVEGNHHVEPAREQIT